MRIAVIALGKIGLPLAVQFARRGHRVVGVDVAVDVVDAVNEGREPFPGEAGLAEYLDEVVASGALRATTGYAAAVPCADVVVVVVPLLVDAAGAPAFGAVDAATRELATQLRAGTLVVYETTLPVGTTRTRVRPMLEDGSGLVEGRDFHLAYSPERVLSGRVFTDLRRYPKLVGAFTDAGSMRVRDFYRQVLDFDERPDLPRGNGVWDLGSPEAAELAKLAETTYRDVNIGLANQFARFAECHGIDVHAVIEASNSQPYSHIHQPGIAVGGHCIPVYPRLYLWNDPAASVVAAARAANQGMPGHAVDRLRQAHGGDLAGARVVVLGAAYRGGVKETACSGVFAAVAALGRQGAVPVVHDPLFTDEELRALGLSPYHLGEPVQAALVQCDHTAYATLGEGALPGVSVVVDGRAVLDASRWPSVRLIVLGRGD